MPRRLGSYQLRREIGRGGMGVVYEAWDEDLRRTVAIKELLAGGDEPDRAAHFGREAYTAAQLEHEHIVRIHRTGRVDGRLFIDMEFVDGLNLAQWLRAGAWPELPVAVAVMRDVCSALEHAHDPERRIMHRDLKPQNVMVRRDGNVKLTDYGLARRLQDEWALTRTGQMKGTPAYVSPEQAGGRNVGLASDVFSAGILAYELFSRQNPFRRDGDTAELVMGRIVSLDPPPLATVDATIPASLSDLVRRMLAKDPAGRPEAGEVVRALDAELVGLGVGDRRALLAEFTRARTPVVSTTAADDDGATPRWDLGGGDPVRVRRTRRAIVVSMGAASAALTVLVVVLVVQLGPCRRQDTDPVVPEPPRPVAPGTLSVAVTPVGARLIIDGVPATSTTGLSLAAGQHRVRADADGRAPVETLVTIRPGAETALRLELPTVVVPVPRPPSAAAAFEAAERISDPTARHAALLRFTRVYPGDRRAPRALYLVGYDLSQNGDVAAAARLFRDVVRRYPRSPEAESARFMLEGPEFREAIGSDGRP